MEIYSRFNRPLAAKWNPTDYNPREWLRLMKAAGVRYICITTKHHDGFCLWPTETNKDWNIGITPWRKDLLKPLDEAKKTPLTLESSKHGTTVALPENAPVPVVSVVVVEVDGPTRPAPRRWQTYNC